MSDGAAACACLPRNACLLDLPSSLARRQATESKLHESVGLTPDWTIRGIVEESHEQQGRNRWFVSVID